ncbi:nucleotidyltransferase domain-containing protein [Bacillus cihuensis]|uniref:nucleotidyltransferase domain-containing protein n=1 Tax=Bacillus cihuensis TaxID=1208599 RepID=UPI000415A384|nr:nucleotidyltransferase domain-containing protein [Bacillus cihuensis]
MKPVILQKLKRIELEFDVKIVYACESGSRAWDFPSKDSDYDVRFIYVHKPEWYLSIDNNKRDVIEHPIHNLLDINGWEITKALRLFRKSNPALLEWMHSSIQYYTAYSTIHQMRNMEKDVFIPSSGVYHYLHMANGNYRDYLQQNSVKIKKYFYVLRPLLAAKWIETYNTFPPNEFQVLLAALVPDGKLKDEITTLLERKIASVELDYEPRIQIINQFIESEIPRLEQYVKHLQKEAVDPTTDLNLLFRNTLQEVWTH